MLYRFLSRGKYLATSGMCCGIILLFLAEYRMEGIYILIGSLATYFICDWFQNKDTSEETHNDQDRNVKPNYR